jgi:hypothetical protein
MPMHFELFKIASVFVRLDHVARFIVNANDRSQPSIRPIERDDAFDIAGRIQNADLT